MAKCVNIVPPLASEYSCYVNALVSVPHQDSLAALSLVVSAVM